MTNAFLKALRNFISEVSSTGFSATTFLLALIERIIPFTTVASIANAYSTNSLVHNHITRVLQESNLTNWGFPGVGIGIFPTSATLKRWAAPLWVNMYMYIYYAKHDDFTLGELIYIQYLK